MKITCPNCQKSYQITAARIPAGAKTAKCKACGHKMPLKEKDPPKPSIGDAVINRSCPYCGKVHALRRSKIPPKTATIKCKSCRRPVPLKLETTAEDGLVHSLKKETSEPRADMPGQPDLINLGCESCGKQYKIPSQKIPPSAKILKCNACGHRISLPETRTTPKKPVPAALDLPPPAKRPGRKRGVYALAACILLVILIGAFAGLQIFKDSAPDQLATGGPEKPTASSALLQEEPFLVLYLNVPAILDNIDNRTAGDKKSHKFRTSMSLAKSLKLKRLEIFLYADEDNQILPIILARGNN
ncbi:MAG: zinc-ribbon domain-containing protein, partial [Desulfobacterales bacterium]